MRGKKGYTYLMTVSFLLVIIVGVFMTSDAFKRQDKQDVYEIRIRTQNDFVKNLNEDIKRASYISAFRTLISLEEHTAVSGEFLEDMESSFRETFFYGTINGTPATLLINSSFSNYTERVQAIAGATGLNVDMNVTHINLSQNEPWSIDVAVTIHVNVNDINNLASWEYTKEYVTNVPIFDLRDPLYGVFTENKIPNTIKMFNESVLVDSDNDTTNLVNFLNGTYYLASNKSPNFIMRFENNTNSDPNGIESIIDIQALSDQDLEVFENRIKVDYIYFNDLGGSKLCDVDGVPSTAHFVITTNRDEIYQIQNLTYNTTCP